MKKITLFACILLSIVLLLSFSSITASAYPTNLSDDDESTQEVVEETQEPADKTNNGHHNNDKGKPEKNWANDDSQLDQKDVKQTENAEHKATQQANKPNKKQNLKGVIEAASAESLSLKVKDGTIVEIALTADTRVKIPGKKDATLADLTAGLQVAVRAVKNEDVLTALSISVVPGKPEKIHRVGTVTEYTAGESITVEAKDGSATTFTIDPEVKILPADLAETLAVGSKVTIISPRDPSTTTLVAKGIVIHPQTVTVDTDVDDE